MKVLIIGGNRFVGLRLSLLLDKRKDVELHVLNRTGQVAHAKNAVVYKAARTDFHAANLDKDWDVIVDFACFTAHDARQSEYFERVGRYIFISTASVYDLGFHRGETDFDPVNWKLHDSPSAKEKEQSYQFGKRMAEAVFAQEAKFPVAMIRFPFIVGADDYTRRLEFHVEHALDGQPIYIPNLKARISMCDSEDAAKFLEWSLAQTFTGPVNVASPEVISLEELVALIERKTGRKMTFAKEEDDGNHSPYGADSDATLNVDKLASLGYRPKSMKAWLPALIETLAPGQSAGLH